MFIQLHRDLAYVNAWKKHAWLLYQKKKKLANNVDPDQNERNAI